VLGLGPSGPGSIPGTPTIRNFPNFLKKEFARFAPQERSYARKNPYISGLRISKGKVVFKTREGEQEIE
tara:strand:- start:53229 stop:53435 length:207 start_codon:yes stop_codon:yes gene_type:complete